MAAILSRPQCIKRHTGSLEATDFKMWYMGYLYKRICFVIHCRLNICFVFVVQHLIIRFLQSLYYATIKHLLYDVENFASVKFQIIRIWMRAKQKPHQI